MKLVLAALALTTACKRKDVPYVPPTPDDAKAVADAEEGAVDAAVAATKARATKVAVGDHASCAVMSDTTVRCWGKNSEGQLGNGTTADSAKPVTVALRGVTDVVLGAAHACALLDDTSVTCWGRINYGAKGVLTKPAAVPGLQGAKSIFAVGAASCATLADGPLVCWGDVDQYGHFRLSGGEPERRAPAPVPGLSRITSVTATGALSEDHTARWFGDKVVLEDVTEISADADRLCGLRSDGKVICAGSRHCAAAAPKPSPAPKPAPKKGRGSRGSPAGAGLRAKAKEKASQPVPAVEELVLPKAKHLAFDVGTCVITQNGQLQCLDSKDGCKLADPWAGLNDAEEISGNCARTKSGTLRCWSVEAKSRAVALVAGVARVTAIAGSSSHVCVLSAGEIICLGSNKYGALGRGENDAGLHLDGKSVVF